jgi:hypothetical protein
VLRAVHQQQHCWQQQDPFLLLAAALYLWPWHLWWTICSEHVSLQLLALPALLSDALALPSWLPSAAHPAAAALLRALLLLPLFVQLLEANSFHAQAIQEGNPRHHCHWHSMSQQSS